MKQTVPGFSILFAFLLMLALSTAALSYVRTSGFLTALGLARQEAEYQYWAAYGLINYASATIRTQKDVPVHPIHLDAWPVENSPYKGIINAVIAGNQIIITIQLLKGQKMLKELTRSKVLEPDFLA